MSETNHANADVQEYNPNTATAPITLTPAALKHIQSQLQKQPQYKGIRFGVKKSGCSGLKYLLDYVVEINPQDMMITVENVMIAMASSDLAYLRGSQIDYVREGLNGQFKFTNPNETASCGCGESFSVAK